MTNWDRTYRFKFGKKGSEGVIIGEKLDKNNMPLRISFSLERNEDSTSNQGSIDIWNLSPEHIALLEDSDVEGYLYAGYSDNMPLLLSGDITNVSSEEDGADIRTSVTITDSRTTVRETYSSVSYNGSTNAKTIIDDCASKLGLTVEYSSDAEFADIPNGCCFVGNTTTLLTKVCETSNLSWSIQNGIVKVKKENGTMKDTVYVLSAKTGLIGRPKRIYKSKTNTSSSSQKGWEVNFLMNAAIQIGDYVKLESKYAEGYFRVAKIANAGDNFSGDWMSTADLYEKGTT